MKKILAILSSGIWITISEFLRNEILFKNYWVNHYDSLGLTFETKPINGIFWAIWSMLSAYIIFRLLQRFSFTDTFILSWLSIFLMMWAVVFNLQVLPLNLLIFAVPLSVLEVLLAMFITHKIQ